MKQQPMEKNGETIASPVAAATAPPHPAEVLAKLRGRDEFLAASSHELRTPMNSILGFTELLLETRLDHQQRDYLNLIKVNCQSLLRSLNNINDLSRLELGKVRLRMRAHQPREILHGVLENLWVEARKKNIDIDLRFHPDLPSEVLTDGVELRRMLCSLLDNAIRYTEEGKVIVEASVRKVSDSSEHLLFSIQDTGPGIPENQHKTLFDVMARMENVRRHQVASLGLELSIANKLCKLFGGELSVKSQPGEGSNFLLSIPFTRMRGSPAKPDSNEHVVSTAVETQMGIACPLRILVVEDEPMNQLLIRRMLAKMGYSADIADNGKAAIDSLAREKYQVILMDIQMPEMDGLDATRHIRAGQCGVDKRGIFISAVTAYAMSGDRERCVAAGMNDYISKPINPQKLRDVLFQAYKSLEDPS